MSGSRKRILYLGIIVILGLVIIFLGFYDKPARFAGPDDFLKDTEIEIKVFENPSNSEELPNSGFGYEIYLGGELFIRQPHIPAIQGLHGFETEEDALRVAELAVEKVRAGIIPPSVGEDELEELGIVF